MFGDPYRLNKNGQPERCSFMEAAVWRANHSTQVVESELPGAVRVSTIFTCINYSYQEDGDPFVYETMVFGLMMDNDDDDHTLQWRYSSLNEAVAHHQAIVERITCDGNNGG